MPTLDWIGKKALLSLYCTMAVSTAAHSENVSIETLKNMDDSELVSWANQCVVDTESTVHVLESKGLLPDKVALGGVFAALIVLELASDLPIETIKKRVDDQIELMEGDSDLIDKKSGFVQSCISNVVYIARRVYERPVTLSENRGNEGNLEEDKQSGNDLIYNYFHRICLSGLTVLDDKNSISLNSKDLFCNCVSLRMKSDSAERPSLYANLISSDDKSKLGEMMESQWNACLSDLR